MESPTAGGRWATQPFTREPARAPSALAGFCVSRSVVGDESLAEAQTASVEYPIAA